MSARGAGPGLVPRAAAWCLALGLAAAPLLARAATAVAGTPALRVGDWSLSAPALRFLQRVAAVRTPEADLATVAASAVQDHVLGEHARATVGDDALFDDRRVARSLAATADADLDASIAAAWRARLATDVGVDGGARFVVRRHSLTRERLRAALGTATPGVRLDDQLAGARDAALDGVPLLDYRFDAGTGTGTGGRVTLGTVWRTLTVQERQVLANGDVDAAFRQATERVRALYVRHWAITKGGLSDADLAALQSLMADHERRAALARWLGAVDDGGFRGPEIERLRGEVSDADVLAYYAAHPDDFPRIERVRARHVRCADAASAQAAWAAIVAGLPFEEAARRWSTASDRDAGGELGWLDADAARDDWLAQVAFALPPGAPTAPLHEPPGPGHEDAWQIVQVHERVTGRHPADSETVRFAARRAIAQERAVAGFVALRARLVARADLAVDASVAGIDAGTLRDRATR